MRAFQSLFVLITLLTLGACSEGNSKPSYQFRPAQEGVAAKVGDITISQQELRDGIESELFEAETKVFDIKFNRLKAILVQKFMDRDSRKQGLSNDEFLNKYITSNVKVSEKEIDAFIKDQSIPAEHINPQVREKIKNYLEVERKKEAVDSWLASQTKKTPVEVFINKPRRPTFPVEVGNAPVTGGKTAEVTIIEFSDFQCPFCAKGADILNQLKQKYGKKIKVAFKNFPLPFHNHAEKAAVAGLCVHEQNADAFWRMHDLMFANQDSLDAEGLKNLAKKVGVKMDQFEKCMAENKHLAQVQSDMEEGRKVGVKSTPTFFINGQLINGAQPVEVFAELIEEQLK